MLSYFWFYYYHLADCFVLTKQMNQSLSLICFIVCMCCKLIPVLLTTGTLRFSKTHMMRHDSRLWAYIFLYWPIYTEISQLHHQLLWGHKEMLIHVQGLTHSKCSIRVWLVMVSSKWLLFSLGFHFITEIMYCLLLVRVVTVWGHKGLLGFSYGLLLGRFCLWEWFYFLKIRRAVHLWYVHYSLCKLYFK